MNILLASSSPYRKQLLEKLHLRFARASPDIDEHPLNNERPDAYVLRLAKEKAQVFATSHPNHWVIASDQAAVLDGQILGKPHTHDNAVKQLMACQGKRVSFLTSLCVLNTATGEEHTLMEPYHVQFRELSRDQIEHYLVLERPYDCAGSFKMEALGIVLFDALEGRDPNALMGLPLMGLVDAFERHGVSLLSLSQAGD